MTSSSDVRNTTWDELVVGSRASIKRICREDDLILFAHASGNTNPFTLPSTRGKEGANVIAPSLWVGSLLSAVLGNLLPGAGTLYLSQNLNFNERVHPGDELFVEVCCTEKREKPIAVFELKVSKANGAIACSGVAIVNAPLSTIILQRHDLPSIIIDQEDYFSLLIERAQQLPPLRTAVVWPTDAASFNGALLSADAGLIQPLLIGPIEKMRDLAHASGRKLPDTMLIAATDTHAACKLAVDMARTGDVRAIMKGNVHSDEILGATVKKDGGLRTEKRISHVFVMDAPSLDRMLFISDAAVNIAPDLATKVHIVQNAIDLARACGVLLPKVGILSAVETINFAMPSTMDAAILSKMADRGQITGGLVDGPLAMDNAVDIGAARTKGIRSLVAGKADILITPNIEAGNMLAKELTFIAKAEAAGIVLGAKAPIMLTSRADNDRARLASSALVVLYDYWRSTGQAAGQETSSKGSA